ncbi:MAG TPA: hypothetical protein VK968_02725, partial [Roseimicrobium sp.]|nr:hypothetical protein [Roseimicrobium sp.]
MIEKRAGTSGRGRTSMLRFMRQAFLFIFASGTVVLAQQPEKPDPLAGLLRQAPPSSGEIRLHITVLSVPAGPAAEAILGDEGGNPSYWRDTLTAWRKAGLLEIVAETSVQGAPGKVLAQRGFPFRYLCQDEASHFWDNFREWEAWGGDRPDANQLFQQLQQEELGTSVEAMVRMNAGNSTARIDLQLRTCPTPPESRPVPYSPLPFFSAPRYFFRPWSLRNSAEVPVNRIFLLGGQMEPPYVDRFHTGHVSMAFTRVSVPAEDQKKAPAVPPEGPPDCRVQTWTLAVPLGLFQEWLLARKNSSGDAAKLETWLSAANRGGDVEILGTSALATISGMGPHQVSGALLWHDAQGWEPSGNPLVFSPLSCDGDRGYSLAHDLEVSVFRETTPADPFAPAIPAKPNDAEKICIEVTITRPSSAPRWVHGKTAFERTDADDPQALEIAEADTEKNEFVTTTMFANPGQISLVGASLRDKRVHASFLRVIEGKPAPPPAPPVSSSTVTTWIIETPLAWRGRLLTEKAPDLKALAVQLLASIGKDGAHCVGLLTGSVRDGSELKVRSTRPRLFFGGDYLNSAAHSRGIYFNPRGAEFLATGEQMTFGSGSLQLHATGEPQTRHWGIWKPDLPSANERNSGTQQPAQPMCDLGSLLR